MLQEKVIKGLSGWLMVIVLAAGILGTIVVLATGQFLNLWAIGLAVLVVAVLGVCFNGLTVVNPNNAKVVLLFGDYRGSIKTPGFWWVNPLTGRVKVYSGPHESLGSLDAEEDENESEVKAP